MRRAGGKAKRRGSDVHLAVANHDVAVAAESLHVFVFVNVLVVGVEKVAVTNDEVEHRIRIAVRLGRVTTEDVEYGPPFVTARRNLTVAVVIGLTPGYAALHSKRR